MGTLAEDREALVDEIVRRWNDNQRGSKIAMAVRVTRSTVMGIVRREKAKGRITRVEPEREAHQSQAPRRAEKLVADVAAAPPPPADAPVEISVTAQEVVVPVATDHEPAQPKTLIDAPLHTCRVVVGQNERGQDLYCCEPIYRQPNGQMARISCCEAHKPRMFSKHSLAAGAADTTTGNIARLSTSFQRLRPSGKKTFAFGNTLEMDNG